MWRTQVMVTGCSDAHEFDPGMELLMTGGIDDCRCLYDAFDGPYFARPSLTGCSSE